MTNRASRSLDTATRMALDRFLASVQSRALQMARMAIKNPEDALDIVQEAMMGFVQHYADKPDTDWAPLFYRVLNSRIIDCHRRHNTRNRWFGWLGFGNSDSEGEQEDPFNQVPDHQDGDPAYWLDREQTSAAMIAAVENLPIRQQQAFLLRIWEGLSTSDTAAAMAVSEGSVKTHLSRAMSNLQAALPHVEER